MVFLSIFAMIYNTFDKICAYEENTTFINICDRFPSASVYAAGKVYYASPAGREMVCLMRNLVLLLSVSIRFLREIRFIYWADNMIFQLA